MPFPSTELNRRRRRVTRLLTGGLALALTGVVLAPGAATAMPLTAPAATAPAAAKAPAAATAPAVTTAVRNLRIGMSGADVKALQNRLISLRYIDVRSATGVFDSGTHHAVVAFQKLHRLTRDGIVGPITRSKLAAPTIPKPRVPRSGGYYEVDLTRQVLFGFSGSTVIRIADTSTGTGRTYTRPSGGTGVAITPTGTFRIQRKIDGWRQSDLGLLWRPAYIYGGIAIHGSSSVPPYPASHGCIRTTIQTQNRMWNYLPIGRIVYVYRS
jgi:N-acetylmuramoyl-L-alanine amidase